MWRTTCLAYGSLLHKLIAYEQSADKEDIQVKNKTKQRVEYIACQRYAEILKVKCQWFHYQQTLLNNVF